MKYPGFLRLTFFKMFTYYFYILFFLSDRHHDTDINGCVTVLHFPIVAMNWTKRIDFQPSRYCNCQMIVNCTTVFARLSLWLHSIQIYSNKIPCSQITLIAVRCVQIAYCWQNKSVHNTGSNLLIILTCDTVSLFVT